MLSFVSLMLALLFFALGVAQRTIWAPPDAFSQQVEESVSTPVLLLDPSVMTYYAGSETLEVEHDGPITVIIARTHDLVGWIGETPYTAATGAATGTMELEVHAGGDQALPGALTSDLWQEVHESEGSLVLPMDLPAGTSVAIIGEAGGTAPSDVRVVWPNVATYPLFGPFMTAGFVLLAFSLLFLVLGLTNHRKKRGPQRATAKQLTRRERRAIAKGRMSALPAAPAAANTAADTPALDAAKSTEAEASSPTAESETEKEGGEDA